MTAGDLITLRCSALPAGTRVAAFHGVEALSRPYEIDVLLAVTDRDADLGAIIGADAVLTIDPGDGARPFLFGGVFASVELLRDVDCGSVARAVMVPRLWLLGLSEHSRVFTHSTLADIIRSVLEGAGVTDYELRLGSYAAEEHVCQYRESDLAFLSRWMEREGIYYWFEHSEGGERLVIADGASYERGPLGGPVRFVPRDTHDCASGPCLWSLRCEHATAPSSVSLRGCDYGRPALDLSASATTGGTGGVIARTGERYFSPAHGTRLATVRAEELAARRSVYRARGNRTHLRAGHTFMVEGHSRGAFNTEYLATSVRHRAENGLDARWRRAGVGVGDPSYVVEVEAITATTQFRPVSTTPWPRIRGVEYGVIDGPAESAYAQIDDQGRYCVKLSFDESSLSGGKASTYVRMAQPHGGANEGFHFPLRKGTEVMLAFLRGDPDLPVITGAVPNAHAPSPVTATNHQTNVVHTGGGNRLELDDAEGAQRVTLKTPHLGSMLRLGAPNDDHNLITGTEGDGLVRTGRGLDVAVAGTKIESVGGSVDERYGGPLDTTVTGDMNVMSNANKSVQIAGDFAHTSANVTLSTEHYKLMATDGLKVSATAAVLVDTPETISLFCSEKKPGSPNKPKVMLGPGTALFEVDHFAIDARNVRIEATEAVDIWAALIDLNPP
jgi:type VI secretion system secreted protein VgrG